MKNKIITILLILAILGLIIYFYNYYNENKLIVINEMTEKDIKFINNKPNIYLFWGKGCSHCEALNKFLVKNNKYFNLYTLEVWHNEENRKLMDEFLEYFDEDYGGVPYLVIGDKSFLGFTHDDEKKLKEYIKKEYNNKNRIDVYKKMKEIN